MRRILTLRRLSTAVLLRLRKVVSGCSSDVKDPPSFLTKCVLDIDIYKNRPSVHEHVKLPNPEVKKRVPSPSRPIFSHVVPFIGTDRGRLQVVDMGS